MYNIEKFEGITNDVLRILFFTINLGIQLGLAFFISLVAIYIFNNGRRLKKNHQTIFVTVFVIIAIATIILLPNPVGYFLPKNYEQFSNSNGNNYHDNEFIEDNSNAELVSPELNMPLTDNELNTVHDVTEWKPEKNKKECKKEECKKEDERNINTIHDVAEWKPEKNKKECKKEDERNIYVTYNTKNQIRINETTDEKKEHVSPVIKEINQRLKDLEQLYRMSQYDGIQGSLAPKEHHTTLPLTTEDNIISRRIQQYTGPDIYNTDGYSYLKNSIWGVPTQRPPVCIGKPVKYPSAYQGGGLTRYGSA